MKICDFGFSTDYINEHEHHITFENKEPVGSPEYNAPEITNKNKYKTYYADQMDFYSAGIVLFIMVMKSAPFVTTSLTDQYFQRFNMNDKHNFWDIFSQTVTPSDQFKGKTTQPQPRSVFSLLCVIFWDLELFSFSFLCLFFSLLFFSFLGTGRLSNPEGGGEKRKYVGFWYTVLATF